MLRIGSNINSLQAQRKLAEATDRLSSVSERLSSGLRINKASDDAAGLSIANGLSVNRRIAQAALRNANDAQSVLSIADGALAQQGGILMRMRELASQSANGTFSSQQRSALNKEFEAIKDEFFRIASTTTFNGISLLNSRNLDLKFQIGLTGNSELFSATIDYQGRLKGKIDLTRSGMNGGTNATFNWLAANLDKTTFTDKDLFESGFDGQIIRTTALADDGNYYETAVFISRIFDGASNDPIWIKAFTKSASGLWDGSLTVFDYNDLGIGNVTLNSNGTVGANNTLTINVGGSIVNDVTVNFQDIVFYDGVNGSNATAALEVLDISNATRSGYALDELARKIADNALGRGSVGAVMQRVNVASGNLLTQIEAFNAAESRIRDADIAAESAEYLRLQILQQTAAAVLKQANLIPELALRLLRRE